MATISEITQGQSYTGNAALGGYIPDAIQIDTNPVMQLAAYTKMQNESLYKQRVADTEAKITQLAELSKLNINDAVGKDKDVAIKAMNNVYKLAGEQSRMLPPKTPQEKLQREADLQAALSESLNQINSINGRGITYKKLLNDINSDASTNANQKVLAKKELEEKFNTTQWNEKVPALEKYTADIPKLSEPIYGKNQFNVGVGDNMVSQTLSWFAPVKTLNASTAEVAGMDKPLPPNATPEQIRERNAKLAAGGEQKEWNDAAAYLTSAMTSGQYLDANNNIDLAKLRNENPMAAGIYELAIKSNQENQEMIDNVKNGYYISKVDGKRLPLPPGITEKDFFIIDLKQPLQPNVVNYLGKYAKAKPNEVLEDVKYTQADLNKKKLAKEWYEAVTGRMNALKPPASADGGKDKMITDPANMYYNHVVRVADYLKRNPNETGMNVKYETTDPATRNAIGLAEGQSVNWLRDGSYQIIGKNDDGQPVLISTGTPDSHKKGLFDATKAGQAATGTQTEGFQVGAEKGWTASFQGETDAKRIFDAIMNAKLGAIEAPAGNTKGKAGAAKPPPPQKSIDDLYTEVVPQ